MTVAEFVMMAGCPVYDGQTHDEIRITSAEDEKRLNKEEVVNFTVFNGYLLVNEKLY